MSDELSFYLKQTYAETLAKTISSLSFSIISLEILELSFIFHKVKSSRSKYKRKH